MQKPTHPPILRATFDDLWRAFVRDLFQDYRPELHYMRGPGPKWRAKHARPESAEVSSGFASASA